MENQIDFLSACYECRLSSPQKFLSFTLLKHNPEIYLEEFRGFKRGYQTGKFMCKANRQQNPYGRWDCHGDCQSKGNESRKRLAIRFL